MITTIKAGPANSYLIGTPKGCFLIDTGSARKRGELLRELEKRGCRPGDLRLIILTHGDSDHSGNAAYLRDVYAAHIAIHAGECGVVGAGDMRLSRNTKQKLGRKVLFATLLPFFRLGKPDRFVPDLCVGDGYDLSPLGLEATVLELSGHSAGSIGVLTADGELFCGDLLMNRDGPRPQFGIDDRAAFAASLERLRTLNVRTAYPGHGPSFSGEELKRVRG
jgi:hydroxyacylglutathione hydrolase